MHIESHTVFETLRKIKKQGHVQEIAKGKWLRNYALSHHDYHLSTVATFSRPNKVWRSSLCRPSLLFLPSLSWLQADTTSCVCMPVRGSMKLCTWTTTWCALRLGSLVNRGMLPNHQSAGQFPVEDIFVQSTTE